LTLAQSSDPREFSNCSGRQRGQLPIQIPISVALDWPSGWNSPAANADRSKPPRGVLLCFRAQLKNWSDSGAHNHSNQNLPDDLRWQIPLLKPHASGFARNLKRDDIRVNRKNYVVLLTVDKPESWKLQDPLRDKLQNSGGIGVRRLIFHLQGICTISKSRPQKPRTGHPGDQL
jgi:hypothetical protein